MIRLEDPQESIPLNYECNDDEDGAYKDLGRRRTSLNGNLLQDIIRYKLQILLCLECNQYYC